MRHFHLIVNPARDTDFRTTHDVEEVLNKAGCTFSKHITSGGNKDDGFVEEYGVTEETECILVIGGDGTFIKAACDLCDLDIPLLGINTGHLGYLTDVEKDNIEPSLTALINDKYHVDERMMIEGLIKEEDKEIYSGRALNDIVIRREHGMKVTGFELYVNGRFLKSYSADGIIVSTPTGSTAYSLSAGGPIVEPGTKIFIVTPICPHTLNTRSVVLSADDDVYIKTNDDDTSVAFDGRTGSLMSSKGGISITESSNVTRIARIRDDSFLHVLHNKFMDTV